MMLLLLARIEGYQSILINLQANLYVFHPYFQTHPKNQNLTNIEAKNST